MKTTILHRSNGGCLLKMDDSTRIRLEALGSKALEILERQDPLLWTRASDSGLLKLIKKEAAVLSCFDVYSTIELLDADAHRGFVTCCLLALRIDELSFRDRQTLQEALLILSECSTIQINPVIVPPFGKLPRKVKAMPALANTYGKMLANRPVSLTDLLRLLKELKRSVNPDFVPLICDLSEVTEGLSKALNQTGSKV